MVAFYVDGLGLARLGGFQGHAGYDGVFVGLPGTPYHLEFTHHVDGSPGDVPTAENPYWEGIGAVTVPDPDGWRVVLAPAPGLVTRADPQFCGREWPLLCEHSRPSRSPSGSADSRVGFRRTRSGRSAGR